MPPGEQFPRVPPLVPWISSHHYGQKTEKPPARIFGSHRFIRCYGTDTSLFDPATVSSVIASLKFFSFELSPEGQEIEVHPAGGEVI